MPATTTGLTTASSSSSSTPAAITSFPRVPLTTTFTPTGSDCDGIYLPRNTPVYMIGDRLSCLPPAFSTSDPAFYYSPGIACPSGYWTACHDTTGAASITTVTCCPTYGDISLSCVPNPLDLAGVWKTLYCTWIAPVSATPITVTLSGDGRTSTVTTLVSSPGGVNAFGVRMVHQSSDLVTSSSSSSSSSSITNSAPPATSSPNANNPTDATSDSGLSTGAKAAIGVVIPLAVLAALFAALILYRRRRRQQQQEQQQKQENLFPPQQGGYSDYAAAATAAGVGAGGGGGAAYALADRAKPGYYAARSPQEMEGSEWERPVEMPSSITAAELPGEGVGGWVRR